MYVVRIENDEAFMFRAFARWTDAKIWASERAHSGVDDELIDVYLLPALTDAIKAVEAVRDGKGTLVATGEKLQAESFRQSSHFLAGMGIGTGAGF